MWVPSPQLTTNHCFYPFASTYSSCHALWIASRIPSFDFAGSPTNPGSCTTHLCRSVNRTEYGSVAGNASCYSLTSAALQRDYKNPPHGCPHPGRQSLPQPHRDRVRFPATVASAFTTLGFPSTFPSASASPEIASRSLAKV